MKKFDHEPTMSELLDLFVKQDMELPSFVPKIKIPIIGKLINNLIKKGMRKSFTNILISD